VETKELTTLDEMIEQLDIIQQLYPEITSEKYHSYLLEMIPHNYKQLAIFEHGICIGLTGFWSGIKLWSGKYIEIDNFIVHSDYRRKGIGKIMTDYISDLAEQTDCNLVVLDAFTGNFKAHRFYYNQGYAPRGFHFVKTINKEGLT
jgi:GNAT superfamily N-acetyltransferase